MKTLQIKLLPERLLSPFKLSTSELTAMVAVQFLLALVLFFSPLIKSIPFLITTIAALTFFIRPGWAIYVLIFFVPILANYTGFYIKPTGIKIISTKPIPLFAPILFFAVIGLIFRKSARLDESIRKVNSWAIPMLLIILYAYISLLLSAPYYEYGMVTLIIIIINFVLYYYFVAIMHESIHRRLMVCWTCVGVITAILNILSFRHIPPQTFYSKDITDSIIFTYNNFTRFYFRGHALGHPNVSAVVLNMTTCVNIGLLLTEKTRWKSAFLWTSLIILIFGNLLTLSKAGLGSFVVMIFFLVMVISKVRKRLFINMTKTIVGVALVFFISFVYYNNTINKDRAFRLFTLSTQSGEEISSLRDRIEMWKAGWAQMDRRKLMFLGLGPGGFEKTTRYPHAHNLYFSFFFDLGIAGVIFELVILISVGKYMWDFLRKYYTLQTSYYQIMSLCFIGGLLALGIQSTVDEYYYKHVVWIFLALAMSTFGLTKKEALATERGISGTEEK